MSWTEKKGDKGPVLVWPPPLFLKSYFLIYGGKQVLKVGSDYFGVKKGDLERVILVYP